MEEGKTRHGCLTAWLVLMIIGNSATALLYLLNGDAIRRALPNIPGWVLPVLIVFAVFNIICTISLLKWKKWGFWGFCVSSLVALIINLSIDIGIAQSLIGLVGVVVLYGVLQIGNDQKGWTQLE
jgi:hypothetical protein